ncbi:MAG: hypothetical protein WCP69_10235 [Bacteroidota bacterium]
MFVKSYSQSYDTIGTKYFKDKFGENINSIDSNGLKQGLWVEYIKEFLGSEFDFPWSLKLTEIGRYIDNNKIGEWNYFYDYRSSTEFYYKDKSVLELRYNGFLSNYYNSDSSTIISTVIDETYLDTFCIECTNKKRCILYSGDIQLDSFDYSPINLFIVQQDIFLSVYRRLKLKKLKDGG